MIVLRNFSKNETGLTDKELNLGIASGIGVSGLGTGALVASRRTGDRELAKKLKGNGKLLLAMGVPLAAASGYYKHKKKK